MKEILIRFANMSFAATLNEGPTADAIWQQLPIEGQVTTWGDEIYFEIPVEMPQESDARQEVEVGELGYWPMGSAFCIFFGPTPVSTDEQPRAYSPVNILGEILGDSQGLRGIKDHDKVKLIRFEGE
jgi:hypothetical protein